MENRNISGLTVKDIRGDDTGKPSVDFLQGEGGPDPLRDGEGRPDLFDKAVVRRISVPFIDPQSISLADGYRI